VQKSTEIEQYSPTAQFVETPLGNVTWTSAGKHTVRIVSSSSSGSSRNLAIDAFMLGPQ
jgi:hypothetical protein